MRASGTIVNPFDEVRPAGRTNHCSNDSSETLLRDPAAPAQPLDASAKREALWRSSTEPGARILHPGLRENAPHDGVHGCVRADGLESTGTLLDASQAPMAALVTAKAEARAFLSTKRLPLGRGFVEGGTITNPPAALSAPGFAFGKPTTGYMSAKELIYPAGTTDPEAEARAELPFAKSHRAFPPGVQRRGAVDWAIAGVDPQTQKFGVPAASRERNSVGRCLNPSVEAAAGGAPFAALTAIVPRLVDDFKALDNYALGQTRGRAAFDASSHPPVYGRRAQRTEAGEWGVADCIRGDYTAGEQAADADLGRATTLGFRNAGFADPARRFGLPSVRTDVAPRGQSMSSSTDFGGAGSGARALLTPSAYADLGVDESDFLAPLAPGRIRMLFEKIGTRFSDAEFAAVYNRAALHGRHTPVGQCCLQEFRGALGEVFAARLAGDEPAWFSTALEEAEAAAHMG